MVRMMQNLLLGIVSDEISLDFQEALKYAKEWGIPLVEIRCLLSGRVPDVAQNEFDVLRKAVEEREIKITALSPGIFKHPLSRREKLEFELKDILPRTIQQARELGAGIVIVFGFKKETGEPKSNFQTAINIMSRASLLAEREHITLAIENEPGCWCDSGENTAELIRAVNSPVLRANWDPCNAFGTGEAPFPDGYSAIKEFIAGVHVKDTIEGADIRCVPVGEGSIDWRRQIAALIEDEVVPHITIETHCLPLVHQSKRNVDTLRRYLNEILVKEKK